MYAGKHAEEEPRLLGSTENELGIRKWLEDQGHELVTTSDKEGPNSTFDKHLSDAEVIITTPFHPGYLTAERLAKAKNLKLAVTAGIGSDHVDLNAANTTNGGITVAEVTGSNVVSVAEHVVMTILNLVRNFVPAHEQVASGRWDVAEVAKNEYDLENKVVGTVAVGRIGERVLRRLKPFECKELLYYDYQPLKPEIEKEIGCRKVDSLEEMLAQCDVVTINCPLHEKTKGLFNKDLISKMKKGAWLVNTARGAIVVKEDVAEALKSGQLRGYGGDVWFPQPAPEDHPLRYAQYPSGGGNATVPHMSGTSIDAQARYAAGTKKILDSYFSGRLDYNPTDLIIHQGDYATKAYGQRKVRRDDAFPPIQSNITSSSSPNDSEDEEPAVTQIAQSLDLDDPSISLHPQPDSSTGEDNGTYTRVGISGLGLEHEYVEVVGSGLDNMKTYGEPPSKKSKKRQANDDDILDIVDKAHPFCLFSSARKRQCMENGTIHPPNPGNNGTLPVFANSIQLESLSHGTPWITNVIGSNHTSYSRLQKPLSTYLIDEASPNHLTACRELREMMMAGEDVVTRAELPCPGMRYPWRVIHLPPANGKRARSRPQMSFQDLDPAPKCKRAKKGKRARIKVRTRLRRTGPTAQQTDDVLSRPAPKTIREDTSLVATEDSLNENLNVFTHSHTLNNEEKQRKAIRDKEKQRERNRKKQRKKREKARQREPEKDSEL
ncbi:MAG: formate dehydrogenase (NAD+) [Alyxoria varia]|nr:MAG: formate dehydrogenase (NAD+) [Alyxoria varia]